MSACCCETIFSIFGWCGLVEINQIVFVCRVECHVHAIVKFKDKISELKDYFTTFRTGILENSCTTAATSCNTGEGQGYLTQKRKQAKIFTALGFILN